MDIKALVGQAKQIDDQSEVKAGGDFEYTPPPEGKVSARFIGYVELGKQPQSHKGEAKPDAEEVRVTFELLGPNNIKEIEVEGGKRKIADQISITMPKKQSDKAKFYKLFKAMTYGRDGITHMAEMLGEAFFVVVKHNKVKQADGTERVYANIYSDGQWRVESPVVEDPIAGTKVNMSDRVHPTIAGLRIFLWQIPTKETWDSLFIDGTREVKNKDGTITEVSKNWLQELILSAKDYGGSALEQLLGGLDKLPTENKQETPKEEVKSETGPETSAPAPDAEAGTKTPEPEGDPADDLAALGLM